MVGASPERSSLDRRSVVRELLSNRGNVLVVSGLGSPTYDVHAAGDHGANFYLWGAMGGAALVGLGVAMAQPERRVLVVTGDGEQLMALGGLATIGTMAPANLDICVLDNERYGETGMQATHTARGVDVAAIALGCGFSDAVTVRDKPSLDELVTRWDSALPSGPRLANVKVSHADHTRSLPSRDGVFIKNRFRAHLGLEPN